MRILTTCALVLASALSCIPGGGGSDPTPGTDSATPDATDNPTPDPGMPEVFPDVVCTDPPDCGLGCPFGWKKDANGCEECSCRECKVDSDCLINCPNAVCTDEGACECGPVCEPLTCKMDCPFGLKQDDKGCDICECRECKAGTDCKIYCANPVCTPEGSCECGPVCEPVTCLLACEFGFRKDDQGCDICECADCKVDTDCHIKCPGAFCSDKGTCECGPVCEPLACKMDCPFGLKQDDKGCDICVCAECQKDEDCPLGCPGAHCSAKKTCECGPTCLPVVCGLYCEHGFLKDADGCDICKCRECETEKDCAGVNCPDPKCAADGLCKCDCSGIPPKDYECPGGVKVPFCACGPLGYQCLPHPEYQCPTLCHPDGRVDFPCASGGAVPWCDCKPPASSCFPVCKEIGSYSEGWYDSCTGDKIAFAICDGCVPVCSAIGTKSEGWVDSCSGKLIRWDNCGMVRDCLESPQDKCTGFKCDKGTKAPYTCPDGSEVPFCRCEAPAAACPPKCDKVGTAEEGWYDSCTGALHKKEKCDKCALKCDAVGSKSEGWYSSCTGLIGWAYCETPTWNCGNAPWEQCTGALACAKEGAQFNLSGQYGVCCPGLTQNPDAKWEGPGPKDCAWPDSEIVVCSYCGDGACKAPENPCSCPEDCAGAKPMPMGSLCGSDKECEVGLTCMKSFEAAGAGVCTHVCTPGGVGTLGCGEGFSCLPVIDSQAPGFCLKSCGTTADCEKPLTCGTVPFGPDPGAVGGCYGFWPPCDPIANLGCGPKEQCRVVKGAPPACGAVGTLKKNDKCDSANDLCGPSLMCGSISQCWPVCMEDKPCQELYKLDFCLKKVAGAKYGHCIFLE